jgi:hypothetical protein
VVWFFRFCYSSDSVVCFLCISFYYNTNRIKLTYQQKWKELIRTTNLSGNIVTFIRKYFTFSTLVKIHGK